MSIPVSRDERLTTIVHGDVQGVGFRYFVQRRATRLGLRGYARNRADGTVEVVAEGPRARLDELLPDLRRGPGGAYVSDVETTWTPAQDQFQGFRVVH